MYSKRIDVLFVVGGIVLGFYSMLFVVSCAIPGVGPPTRVIDASGKVVYEPTEPAQQVVQVPSTGSSGLDYALATMAAAVYGAMGYYIRRTKVNGAKTTTALDRRLKRIEELPIIQDAEVIKNPRPKEKD